MVILIVWVRFLEDWKETQTNTKGLGQVGDLWRKDQTTQGITAQTNLESKDSKGVGPVCLSLCRLQYIKMQLYTASLQREEELPAPK